MRTSRRILPTTALLLICVTLLAQPAQKPKLVLFISIDQMRPDYLERFAIEYTGGFKKLLKEGIVFKNADLNYASSQTGPGHAALGTGSYPGRNGIPSNEWIDRATGKQVYCVQDSTAGPVEGEGGGVSPRNLVVTSLGDWLKSASPQSKVITASAKDRAAILMGGRHPDYAFWYDRNTGHMVTSDYYTHQLPDYVKAFNASGWIERNVPDAWTKLLPDSVYTRLGPDEMEGELKWNGSSAFPHTFQPDKKKEQILTSTYGDLLILDFAKEVLRAEKLGQRGVTDLLCVSLSCTDYIGHSFGPNSHEIYDHLLRLDRGLGEFFSYLEEEVGAGNVLVALSADHAVLELPEHLAQVQHKAAKRISFDNEVAPKIQELDRSLQREIGIDESIIRWNAFLNYAAAAKVGVDSLRLERKIRDGLLKIDGVVDVYFRRELTNRNTPNRPYLRHFQRSYYPPRGEDFLFRGCEYCLFTSWPTGTSHGSPYRYDTHVPMVFWGKGLRSLEVSRETYTVDIAPTIAKFLRISYPANVDGVPLREIVR